MAIVTVRPDQTLSGSAQFALSGNATWWGAVSDSSDTSFLRKETTVTGQASILFGCGTTTIGSSQKVRAVRLRVRADSSFGTSAKLFGEVGTRIAGVSYFAAPLKITSVAATTTYTGQWVTQSPDGQEWDQTRIDALRVQVTEYKDSADRTRFHELYVDVDLAPKPSVTVNNPTGTYTATSRPDVTWTYSDTESLPQRYYQVKIFSQAQYSAVGFNPATDLSIQDSGIVISGNGDAGLSNYLANGTYRAYVRVAKDVNGSPFFSDWAYSQFTINVTPPSTPTLTATYSSVTNSVALEVTGSALSGGFTTQEFQVERSIDGGSIWELVRNADNLIPDASYKASVVDYEASRGLSVGYRARVIANSATDTVPSAYSTTKTVNVVNDGKWWFKAVRDASLNYGPIRVTGDIPVEIAQPSATFQPIGSNRSVVVLGDVYGNDGSFEIVTIGNAEWLKVQALITHQNTLLVQTPFGDQKYVRITKRNFTTEGAAANPIRRISVDYAEVEA